jgi:hypothetical protein
MILPLWAIYGLLASLCVVAMLMIQEKHRGEGFAVAFWIKFFVVLWTLPLVLKTGLPDNPEFYMLIAVSAVLYCLSDVVYMRAIPQIGSGLLTRVMPGAVVLSFLLWLMIDHQLIDKYLDHPYQSAGIFASVLLAAISAAFLKKCPVSWQGIRLIWFCIFAATVGPTLNKIILNQTLTGSAAVTYVATQGLLMVLFWSIYYAARKPIPVSVLFSRHNIKVGFMISGFSTGMMLLKTQAVLLADNPAYVSIMMYTDALWVILIYKLIGRKETGNIWAGLGVVASAIMLIIFKSLN